MLTNEKTQRAFSILTIVVSTGIAWRTFGASMVNAVCRLFEHEPIVIFEDIEVFKQLVNLAMTMLVTLVGKKGVDRYIDYRQCQAPRETKRDASSRTRSTDKEE